MEILKAGEGFSKLDIDSMDRMLPQENYLIGPY